MDGTIGRWAEDAACVFDRLTEGPQVLVGSSMGGWIALLLALRRPERVAALLGIAAAPDFTARIVETLPAEAREAIAREGVWHRPSAYGDPYPITRALLEEGERHMLLARRRADPDLRAGAAAARAARPGRALASFRCAWRRPSPAEDAQVVLVKDGDHRLSRPQDLALLRRTLAALLAEDGG